MTGLIQSYYDGEKNTALLGLVIAAALVLVSLVIWKVSAAGTIPRGVAYALFGFGIFLGTSSGSYLIVLNQRMAAVAARPSQSELELKTAEISRMEKVMQSGYLGALGLFTGVIAVGLVLVFLSHGHELRKGVALGLLVAGVIGHYTEAFSMQKNREHLARVQAYETDPP